MAKLPKTTKIRKVLPQTAAPKGNVGGTPSPAKLKGPPSTKITKKGLMH